MLQRTIPKSSPIITILSSSTSTSRRAQSLFQSIFGMEERCVSQIEEETNNDALNAILPTLPFFGASDTFSLKKRWDSKVSHCPSSGAVLHFLSLQGGDKNDDDKDGDDETRRNMNQTQTHTNGELSLLAITPAIHESTGTSSTTPSTTDDQFMVQSIQAARNFISHQITSSHPSNAGTTTTTTTTTTTRTMIGYKLALLHSLGKPITVDHLLGTTNGRIPMQFPTTTSTCLKEEGGGESVQSHNHVVVVEPNTEHATANCRHHSHPRPRLREIVLSYMEDDASSTSIGDPNGKTLLQTFSKSRLIRPVTGLYQWPKSRNNNKSTQHHHHNHHHSITNDSETTSTTPLQQQQQPVCFRPLPSAKEDMTLSPPTLVFQCNSLTEIQDVIQSQKQQKSEKWRDWNGVSTAKVGFSGSANYGQLQVSLPNIQGLELRFCDSTRLSSCFAEAQESLMAGSLNELQNVNVMAEGGVGAGAGTTLHDVSRGAGAGEDQKEEEDHASSKSRIDSMNGLGDCWVEFRANMKKPSGYLKNVLVSRNVNSIAGRRPSQKRIAKAPNLPYE